MKKITLIKAVLQILDSSTTNLHIDTLVSETKKLTKSRTAKKKIVSEIKKMLDFEPDLTEYVLNKDKIICSRESLFAKTKFKIKLTDKEFNEKKLYIGHRFTPYISEYFEPADVILLDNKNKKTPQSKDLLHISVAFVYISLLDLTYFFDIEGAEEDKINLTYFDLSDWIEKNNFSIKDYLLVEVVDLENYTYRFEKLTNKDYNRQKLLIKAKDAELEEAVENTIKESLVPATRAFFKSFAIIDAETVNEPGSPIGMIINNSEKITLDNKMGISFLKFEGVSLFEQYADDLEIPEQGMSKTIDGIFTELGISFTANFVKALVIQQVINKQKFDTKKILSIIFRKNHIFSNKKQENNFNKAFNKLVSNTTKTWTKIQVNNDTTKLLELAVKIQIVIIKLLRATDYYLSQNDTNEFDFEMLEKFKPLEMLSENLIIYFVDNKTDLPTIEARSTIKQLTPIYKVMKEEIKTIIKSYNL